MDNLIWFHSPLPNLKLTAHLLLPSRMIPPSSKSILVNNLAAGTNYDLCVLAIYDDQVTSLTATRVIGCIHFATEPQYLRCHFMQSQFLGGTIVVVIGGIIVASVLAFIIFLIVRYRVCNQGDADKVSPACILFFSFFCSFIECILKSRQNAQ